MLPFHGLYTKMEGPAPFYLRVHAAMVPIEEQDGSRFEWH